MTPRRRIAFFDVDDTLITIKSMFRFLRFDILTSGRSLNEYEEAMRQLKALKAGGAPREEANKLYYRHFGGRLVTDVAARAAAWYLAESRRDDLFNPHALRALREHREAGDTVVLVSGSFPPCLDPIGAHVRADAILCSSPEVRDGRYTGHLAAPMIGPRKAEAIRARAAADNVRLGDCWGYGDHVSDLPMLCLVGNAVVVGDDLEMREHVSQHAWETLPAH